MTSPLRIALTPGEPAGIGPDLCIQLAQRAREAELVAIADPAMLERRARELGLPLALYEPGPGRPASAGAPGSLGISPVALAATATPGKPDPANATAVLHCLDRAVTGCLEGTYDALVTGPVHKGVINAAGVPFTGHTEYLAQRSGTPRVVMMLATTGLRVALATTHLPLARVSDALTPGLLEETLRIVVRGLREDFAIAQPRVLVCGLNPHAGEDGHLGREEIDVMQPVLDTLRGEGMNLRGPLPADTAFLPARLADCDAVVAMYHDQGLPVLKHLGFGDAVNITLGLPFVRTSVDHGTALELAGTGRADGGSLRMALSTAVDMARHRAAPR